MECETVSPSSSEKLVKIKNPWGTSGTQKSCSLMAVMDEELAKKLQKEEEDASRVDCREEGSALLAAGPSPPGTQDDLMLAQMLQLEYDREHDLRLRAEEKHFNKHSKVHVSFEKYRSLHPYDLEDAGEEPTEEEEEEEVGNRSHNEDCRVQVSRGHRRSKGVSVGNPTKHDAVLCGRRNVQNMEKFPPDFPAGDLNEKGQDYRLPNSVFNTLKLHSHKEEKYAQKLHEKKEHSTYEQALDEKTRLMLFKMVDGGILSEVNGCISTGKEACIYHARGGESADIAVPDECAVKIFKTTLNEFKNRDRYIKDDFRFRYKFSKQNPRKLVRVWAEKEMHNLNRMSRAGLRCPEVVLLKKHVLIMSFIGEEMRPAPKLHEVQLSDSQLESAYQQCIKGMRKLYTDCHLVHADLSEYNMLWHRGEVVFIDVGQSVEPSHPYGLEFLFRDCLNVSRFFSQRWPAGKGGVMGAQELFNYVTRMGLTASSDEEFRVQFGNHRQREKLEQLVHSKVSYPFDYFFEKTAGAVDSEDSNSDDLSPPAEEDGTCSPAEEDGTRPPAEEDGTRPPAEEDGTCPPAEEDRTRLPAEEDGTHPPAEEDGTRPPAEEDGTRPPAEEDGTCPPAEEDRTRLPAEEDGTHPPAEEGGMCPPAEEDGTHPSVNI